MKSKILSFAAALAAIILPSCNEGWTPEVEEGEGSVMLSSMTVGVDLAENEIISRAETSGGVDISNFIVTIKNSKGATAREWTYSNMPEVFTLPVGTYTVEVASHRAQKAEWASPLYKGSSSFKIENLKVTEIGDVVCRFANVKISVEYGPNIVKELGDDVRVTVVANDDAVLIFDKNETRSGYFEAVDGNTTIVVTFSGTVCGVYQTITDVIENVKAGDHHKIKYVLKNPTPDIPNETGGVEPGVGIDSSVTSDNVYNNVQPNENPLPDDGRPTEKPDGPGTDPDGPGKDPNKDPDKDAGITIEGEAPLNLDIENGTDLESYIVNITSKTGLTHLRVRIISDTLTPDELDGVGLADQFDLAYPSDNAAGKDLTEGFQGLGFPYGDQVIGATEVKFEITTFVPMLGVLGEGVSKFVITAENESGSLTKTLTIKVD